MATRVAAGVGAGADAVGLVGCDGCVVSERTALLVVRVADNGEPT